MSTMTPYKASKVANAAIKDAGIEKVLPPQMFYTYTNKGYIKSVDVDGKKRITEEGLQEWLRSYVNKLLGNDVEETDENVDADQLSLFDSNDEVEVVESTDTDES